MITSAEKDRISDLFAGSDENSIDVFHAEYEVKEELGRGLTSVVHKCVHRSSREEFALKIINALNPADVDLFDAIANEVTVLTDLPPHPNIITMNKAYHKESTVYVLLELANDGVLFDFVNRSACLMEKTAAMLFRQLLLGLKHLHDNQIIHRDIKMENLLISDNRTLKLTDFGFAKKLRAGEKLRDLCGTLSYLSPEMIRSEYGTNPHGYGKEVDMWACGVLLYILLMGQPPFANHRKLHLLRQIQEGRYVKAGESWIRLSDPARDIIDKLLQVDTSQRLNVDEALTHPWLQAFKAKKGRKTFRQAAILAVFICHLRRITLDHFGQNLLELVKTGESNPYAVKEMRRVMDDAAFSVYGHWVQREEPASRSAMFCNFNRPVPVTAVTAS